MFEVSRHWTKEDRRRRECRTETAMSDNKKTKNTTRLKRVRVGFREGRGRLEAGFPGEEFWRGHEGRALP